MSYEILIVFGIIICAVVLFATEKISVDLVAITVMATLIGLGIITVEDGISGFSNKATVTVGAMFVISAGLFKTGAVTYLGKIISDVFARSYLMGLITVMIVVAFFSAFVNNTPVVAIFIPILLGVAKDLKASTSKLLMPMSFASMFGGVCTLLGSSTNILVSSIAEDYKQDAFHMFEFAPLGIVMFVIGTSYMLLIGNRLIPERRVEGDLIESFDLKDYIAEIVLLDGSASIGKAIKNAPLVKDIELKIIEIHRGKDAIPVPSPNLVLREGDALRVSCDIEELKRIQDQAGISLKPQSEWQDEDIETEAVKLVEVVIAPASQFVGSTLKQLKFREVYGATVLAVRHRGKLLREKLADTKLDAGDALLLEVRTTRYNQLKRDPSFFVISDVEQQNYRRNKLIPALLIVFGVVLTASIGIMSITASSVIGAVLLVLTGSITMEEAYKAIEWRIIFLLAGILTLGIALERTGGAELISNTVFSNVAGWLGLVALVSIFYLMTSVLTEVMSNNATAALLAPIAIATANSLGVNPRPFLVAVMFAASASFMTPVGYQTNTLIYGPGQYKFSDFLKVGTPLNILFWITATLLIPYIWSFER
ncbi:MAG: SLC13 family permease [Pyrinomonadaceae bacterium]|nr:SLC13 family permease [Pyrinomonadaceae bacterium]